MYEPDMDRMQSQTDYISDEKKLLEKSMQRALPHQSDIMDTETF